MSAHPIRTAFEHSGDEPSPEFRDALRVRFLAELVSPTAATGTPDREETIVTVTEETPRLSRSRTRVVLGIAALIVAIAGLTVVVITHRSQPAGIDTSRDPAIAKDAVISVDELGSGWGISSNYPGLTSRTIADIAATVPGCAPYFDYAFDSPRRQAVTAGTIFDSPRGFALTQWVYIFPTKDAASKAMNKIAENGFVPCMNSFIEAMVPKIEPPGITVKVTSVAAPPMLPHGDRQVVVGQFNTFQQNGVQLTSQTVMHVFVQVGRGIVYIDPSPDFHDSKDPKGPLEKAVAAATNDLKAALAAKP